MGGTDGGGRDRSRGGAGLVGCRRPPAGLPRPRAAARRSGRAEAGMIPRDYQRAAVDAARARTAVHGNTMLVLPTGAGKTATAGLLHRRRGGGRTRRALFGAAAHRRADRAEPHRHRCDHRPAGLGGQGRPGRLVGPGGVRQRPDPGPRQPPGAHGRGLAPGDRRVPPRRRRQLPGGDRPRPVASLRPQAAGPVGHARARRRPLPCAGRSATSPTRSRSAR